MYAIILLFIAIINAQSCRQESTRMVLNFEEFSAPYGTQTLPRPYNELTFFRINTPYTNWPNDLVQVINTTYQPEYFPEWLGTASSPPNGIYTAGEIMSVQRITQTNQKTFTLFSFKMGSATVNNLQVFVNTSKTNPQGKKIIVSSIVFILNVGSITTATLNQSGIEGFSISCVNDSNCGQIVYDDIDFCF